MRRWFTRIRNGALWLVLGFMLFTIVRTAVAEPPTTPRPSDVENAQRTVPPNGGVNLRIERPEGSWVGGLGIVEPVTPERELVPSTAGRIAVVWVKEGEFVEAGTVLAELESDAERAALTATQADVTTAELELRRVRGSSGIETLAVTQREAEAARVRAELSKSILERLEATASAGGVSPDELERARRQAEQDALAADASQARRKSAEEGRPIDVLLAQSRLEAARSRRDQAQAVLDRTRIVAPLSGEILEVLYRVGEYVQPGAVEPLMVMGDTRSLTARIDVDERDVDALVPGGRAIVTVDALPGRKFEGRIVTIARRMGRKNVRSNEPTERLDTKILEVVVELGAVPELIVGQRVMGYLEKAPEG